MTELLSTKEVAGFLKVNEKMVYTLIAEKGLPATKITGKWAFPKQLVEQWLKINTINYPKASPRLTEDNNLLVITGSNDPLLERTITLFNNLRSDFVAVFANLGSMGGLMALRQSICHIASSHLLQDDDKEYNFDFAVNELKNMPAIVNFCKREQGLLIQKGNPDKISSVSDLSRSGISIANRPLGTGTRLLFDKELEKKGIKAALIKGYDREFARHLDVAIEVASGRAQVAPGIRVVANLLDIDFIPLRWESFDLLIPKDKFFEKKVQLFISLLHEDSFRQIFDKDSGYDLSLAGKVLFPNE
ncbi:helix-turn-helix transcriptional regulator [bacterium]|nr:helix-turn-helix transcriptional regulator [bacterium]